MKVIDLFPAKKRVVGWDEHGRRTANSLRQDQAWHDKHGLVKGPSWEEMQADILACETPMQLQKCRWFWSSIAERDKWPGYWLELAGEEFDKAALAIEALAAQQAE